MKRILFLPCSSDDSDIDPKEGVMNTDISKINKKHAMSFTYSKKSQPHNLVYLLSLPTHN